MLGDFLYDWSPEKDLIKFEQKEILDLHDSINETTTFEEYDILSGSSLSYVPTELLVKYLEKEKLLLFIDLDICDDILKQIQIKSNKSKYCKSVDMLKLIDNVATKYDEIWSNYISKITLMQELNALKKYTDRIKIEIDSLYNQYSAQFNDYIKSCGTNGNCNCTELSREDKIIFNNLFSKIKCRYAAIINNLGDKVKVIDNISENKNVSEDRIKVLIDILKSFNCAVTLYKSVLTIMLITVDVQTSTTDKPKRANFLSILNEN